ncbi:DUF4397 domain-containing protein [Modestobacter lapidis]|nr:DUF4397 domain-containing protein [Modestobacter lapidis]
MTPSTRAFLLSLLVAGLAAFGLAPAAAAPGDAAAGDATPAEGLVRMAHLSPDTPAVDAYIDSVSTPGTQVVLPAVTYGDVSPYQPVPAGTYTVSARNAGADPAGPPALATTVTVEPGRAVTIAGVGYFADLRFAVLSDDLTLPPAGQARARVINAAASASPLDLSLAGSAALATGLEFGASTDYVDVPGGAGTLTVAGSGAPVDLPVELPAGSVHTVLVLDRSGGGITVQSVLDAAGPGVVPTGGVETGAGGTAGGTDPWAMVGPAVAALAALGLLLTALLRRPDRDRAPRHAAS